MKDANSSAGPGEGENLDGKKTRIPPVRHCQDSDDQGPGYGLGPLYNRKRDPLGYYALLLVSVDAGEEEIYTVYHLRFTSHPPPSTTFEERLSARKAYEILSDPIRRANYDPEWKSSSGRPKVRHGEYYLNYLRIGGIPYSAAKPMPEPKPWGCLGSLILVGGLILLFV